VLSDEEDQNTAKKNEKGERLESGQESIVFLISGLRYH